MLRKSIMHRLLPLTASIIACVALAGCSDYAPGDPNPNYPHVISTGGGLVDSWTPAPGYTWVNSNAEGDLRVRWVPGSGYWYLHQLKWPNVIAGNNEGNWYPAPGYTWADVDANGNVPPGDFAVAWREGLPYMERGYVSKPHLISSKNLGVWYPDPGYVWARLDANGNSVWDAGVIWKPGASYAVEGQVAWAHIYAAEREGSWMPESGYAWAHQRSDGSLTDYAVYSVREDEEYRAHERALDERWVSYLKEIQAQGDFPNWPSPPYDLYQQTHH
jgi:hypothetical protein